MKVEHALSTLDSAAYLAAKMTDMGHEVLYFENTEGGHGAGVTPEQRARMYALTYGYLWKMLGEDAPPRTDRRREVRDAGVAGRRGIPRDRRGASPDGSGTPGALPCWRGTTPYGAARRPTREAGCAHPWQAGSRRR